MAKQELLDTIRDRYRSSPKKDKTRILDEFIAVTGHHRKHGIRLLGKLDEDARRPALGCHSSAGSWRQRSRGSRQLSEKRT